MSYQQYQAPPGPPPSRRTAQPPQTYSPEHGDQPPAYTNQSQTAPNDTTFASTLQPEEDLPPPPTLAYLSSPTSNSSHANAERAAAFTDANPLFAPRKLEPTEREALSMGYSSLVIPRELTQSQAAWCCRPSTWAIRTQRPCGDACFLSSMPLYSALYSLAYASTVQCYFEVAIKNIDQSVDSGVAVGFAAQPYPTWRMPGHERASLGVHGDDGRRFINDSWGGRDFVNAFRGGDIVGIGIRFNRRTAQEGSRLPAYNAAMQNVQQRTTSVVRSGALDVQVFFTRNGEMEAGWDLHEMVDAEFEQPGGVIGLEGQHDLYAAVGIWGKVDLEVRFGRNNWQYKLPAR